MLRIRFESAPERRRFRVRQRAIVPEILYDPVVEFVIKIIFQLLVLQIMQTLQNGT